MCHGLSLSMNHGVVTNSFVENGRFFSAYCVLLREWSQLGVLALDAWIGRDCCFAGVMLDIDKFKDINDNFGHSEGDKALKSLTNILKKSAGNGEVLFRFAGDEFIVLKMETSINGLEGYMKEVQKHIDAFNREGHPYKFSISYGTAYFDGTQSADSFLKEMDLRMYMMKEFHHDEIIKGEIQVTAQE